MPDLFTHYTTSQKWWDKWWADDFSWNGLKELPLGGVEKLWTKDGMGAPPYRGNSKGHMHLQDYWRYDFKSGSLRDDDAMKSAGELVEFDGMLFHIAHLPPFSKNGVKSSWKAHPDSPEWDILENLLALRLELGTDATVLYLNHIDGHDDRAQFRGVSMRRQLRSWERDAARQNPLAAHAQQTAFLFFSNFSDCQFHPSSSFENSLFCRDTRFDSTTFRGDARFNSSVFLANAYFDKALFRRMADFSNASFMAGAYFRETQFHGYCRFDKSNFSKDCSFQGAKFLASGNFGADFATLPDFTNVDCARPVTLEKAVFTELDRRAALVHFSFWLWLLPAIFLFILTQGSWLELPTQIALLIATWGIIIFSGTPIDSSTEAQKARVLLKMASSNRDHLEEARFFQIQLKAQRFDSPSWGMLKKNPMEWLLAKPVEKALGVIYEATSNYGLSVARPLLCLVILVLSSAYLMWGWERGAFTIGQSPSPPHILNETSSRVDLADAVLFSASRTFPVSLMPTQPALHSYCSFGDRFLAASNCRPSSLRQANLLGIAKHRLAANAYSALQSIISIFLIFSFGLALRRRFQLS